MILSNLFGISRNRTETIISHHPSEGTEDYTFLDKSMLTNPIMVATLLTPISFSLFFSFLSVFFLPLSSLLPAFFLLSGWFLKL